MKPILIPITACLVASAGQMDEQEIVGKWQDNVTPAWQSTLTITNDEGGLFMVTEFADGSSHRGKLVEIEPLGNERRRFHDPGLEETYAINANGQLDLCDRSGCFREAKKIE